MYEEINIPPGGKAAPGMAGHRQDIWEDDLYSFYLDYAVYRMVEKTSVIYRYDMDTGESGELCRGECPLAYSADDGKIYGWDSLYQCMGWYDDSFVVYTPVYDEESRLPGFELLLWDGTSGLESLMQAGNAGIPRMYFGSVGNHIRDTDQIIYYKDKDDGSVAEVYSYDLEEKKSTFLFEDDSNVTLRFLGETENEFICERVAGEEQSVCKISKDSYYGGDIDDAVKLMDGN